jgi:hypothetical protein
MHLIYIRVAAEDLVVSGAGWLAVAGLDFKARNALGVALDLLAPEHDGLRGGCAIAHFARLRAARRDECLLEVWRMTWKDASEERTTREESMAG